MFRFNQIVLSSLLALCLGQDSGLYVNRIKIETFASSANLDRAFTYYVADSFDQSQKDNFKTAAGSIGNLFEDDYAADTATCTNTECPKLRRIYVQANTGNGTRIIDSELKASLGATDAKPIGLVAPYPGYCSSDDAVPIIEMYSATRKRYAYWSPAQPNQLVNLAATTLDNARYNPVRLVGYALSAESGRLVLENAQPDYVKPISRSNYTHSFYPARQLIQFTSATAILNIPTPSVVDQYSSMAGYTLKNTGLFLLGTETSDINLRLDKKCGQRYMIYVQFDKDSTFMNLMPQLVKSPNIPVSGAGYTFKENRRVCGGIKGLGEVKEFLHKTKPGYYTYENDDAKKKALTDSGEWTVTAKVMGFAPLDQIGFLLINDVI